MKRTDLKRGKVIYLVNEVSRSVQEIKIKFLRTHKFRLSRGSTIFAYSYPQPPTGYTPYFSLRDYNIGCKNNYNKHKAFFTAPAAHKYIDLLNRGII